MPLCKHLLAQHGVAAALSNAIAEHLSVGRRGACVSWASSPVEWEAGQERCAHHHHRVCHQRQHLLLAARQGTTCALSSGLVVVLSHRRQKHVHGLRVHRVLQDDGTIPLQTPEAPLHHRHYLSAGLVRGPLEDNQALFETVRRRRARRHRQSAKGAPTDGSEGPGCKPAVPCTGCAGQAAPIGRSPDPPSPVERPPSQPARGAEGVRVWATRVPASGAMW
jgi:hypothetical protein